MMSCNRGSFIGSLICVSLYFLNSAFVDGMSIRKEDHSTRTWRSTLVRDRESLPDYQPLCHSVTHRVDMIETGFEFRPPFYHSVECRHISEKRYNTHKQRNLQSEHDDICIQSGLSCVQRYRTIQLAKRRVGNTCWTIFTKEVPSGCECMWPVETHGDSRYQT